MRTEVKSPLNRLIVLEGINGTGKTTIFNYLKATLPKDNFIFLDFHDYYKNATTVQNASIYVNKQIAKVWNKADFIIADRWIISDLIYNRYHSYLSFVDNEYKAKLIPDKTYFLKPGNVFKTYLGMIYRNIVQRKKNHINVLTYLALNKKYNNFFNFLRDTTVLEDTDIIQNYYTIYNALMAWRDALSVFEELNNNNQ